MCDPLLVKIYSGPQNGGELPYFVGRQYGQGWLRTLGRIAFPILRSLGIVAANTAEDVIMNDKKIMPTLADQATREVKRVYGGVATKRSTSKGINKVSNSIFNNKRYRRK